MMENTDYKKTQARQFLKYETLTEITDISDFANFYRRVYSIIAKYGFQIITKPWFMDYYWHPTV